MSVPIRLQRLLSAARNREWLIAFASVAPLGIAIAVVVADRFGPGSAAAFIAVAMGSLAAWAWRRARHIDTRWLAHGLDAARADFEDSSELLFRDSATLSALQLLQQGRMRRLLDATVLPDLRSAWPWRRIALCVALALALFAAHRLIADRVASIATAQPTAPTVPTAPTSTALTFAEIEITPPSYTGLSKHRETVLDANVPEGARLRWRLQFDNPADSVALEFHDHSRVALAREGDAWLGSRTMTESGLYRVVLGGAPGLRDDALHRIDVSLDQPPEVRVIAPDKTLSVLADGQNRWDLAFEASDDYAVADAILSITLAQGSGENIQFKESQLHLRGEGDARVRRYQHSLDLAALGIAQGDDVVVRLAVSDTHPPKPNVTRSASFILRWLPDASAESSGMDGLVRTALPAFFRSQRQIIIDTQALIVEKTTLPEDRFISKSDSLGVDQKILRLRYGQFLGEEFESEPGEHRPPGLVDKSKSGDAKAGDTKDAAAASEHDAPAESPGHADGATPSAAAGFGVAGNVLVEYGHAHDHAEAATLLDPETRRVLKAALDQMWRAEEQLRLAQPSAALPFEFKALEYIKQVQQATRIYLARVGLELPPVDETRRLSGERKDLADRNSGLVHGGDADATVANAWSALAGSEPFDATAFDAWLRTHTAQLPDALGLIAANDALLRDAHCAECRTRLRGLLWPLLATPVAAPRKRENPDAAGLSYLDALAPDAVGKGASR